MQKSFSSPQNQKKMQQYQQKKQEIQQNYNEERKLDDDEIFVVFVNFQQKSKIESKVFKRYLSRLLPHYLSETQSSISEMLLMEGPKKKFEMYNQTCLDRSLVTKFTWKLPDKSFELPRKYLPDEIFLLKYEDKSPQKSNDISQVSSSHSLSQKTKKETKKIETLKDEQQDQEQQYTNDDNQYNNNNSNNNSYIKKKQQDSHNELNEFDQTENNDYIDQQNSLNNNIKSQQNQQIIEKIIKIKKDESCSFNNKFTYLQHQTKFRENCLNSNIVQPLNFSSDQLNNKKIQNELQLKQQQYENSIKLQEEKQKYLNDALNILDKKIKLKMSDKNNNNNNN